MFFSFQGKSSGYVSVGPPLTVNGNADLTGLKKANESLNREITLLKHQVDEKSRLIRVKEKSERNLKEKHQNDLKNKANEVKERDKENKKLNKKLEEQEAELRKKDKVLLGHEQKLAELQKENQKLLIKLQTVKETQRLSSAHHDYLKQKEKLQNSQKELDILKERIQELKKGTVEKDAALKNVEEMKTQMMNMNSKMDAMMNMMQEMCAGKRSEVRDESDKTSEGAAAGGIEPYYRAKEVFRFHSSGSEDTAGKLKLDNEKRVI